MPLGLAFYIILLVLLILAGWSTRSNPWGLGISFGAFLLILLLGWAVFGPPIRG